MSVFAGQENVWKLCKHTVENYYCWSHRFLKRDCFAFSQKSYRHLRKWFPIAFFEGYLPPDG